jgi:hypothetical protein
MVKHPPRANAAISMLIPVATETSTHHETSSTNSRVETERIDRENYFFPFAIK